MLGPFFQCNTEDEVTTRRGTDTPVASFGKPPRFQIQLDKCPVTLRTTREASGVPFLNTRRGLTPVSTLQRPCNQSQKWRGTLRFLPQLELRPSSIAPNPVESRKATPNSTVSLISQRHPEKLPEVSGTSRGNPGFPGAARERPRESFFNAS